MQSQHEKTLNDLVKELEEQNPPCEDCSCQNDNGEGEEEICENN